MSRGVVGAFIIAALSQARVQLVERGSIMDAARKNSRFMVTKTDVAKRGWITSSDNKPLAQDEDSSVLTIDFDKIPHSAAFYMEVSAATGIPASEFAQLAKSDLRTRPGSLRLREWKHPLSAEQARQVQEVKTSWRADGISVTRSGRRSYPLGDAAAGVVGIYQNKLALTGLERGDNKILSGRDGKTVGVVDRTGHFLPSRLDSTTVQKMDGQNIQLTIDSELQLAAAHAIREAVESNKARQGVAIVIDPKTGDLLAMANWPSADPNSMEKVRTKENTDWGFDPSYMAKLEPGSMFKILTLAKALDQGVLHLRDTVYCHGAIQVGKRTIKCDSHHGNRAHGLVDPELAIAKSCNISAATWALRIGHDSFIDYTDKLGVFKKTDLGLPSEVPGYYNRRETATYLQTATMGFGQSMACTPVGLASAFAMLGNNGVRMMPRLIKKIGNVEQPLRPAGQVVSPQTAGEVLHIMRSVIESDAGTGKDLRIPGYVMGGKTGTAQKVGARETIPDPAHPGKTISIPLHGYVSNFVGFVPAEQPRAVILVMVDNPQGGKYYGASVAGPVFVSLAKSVIRKLGIPPSISVAEQSAMVSEYHEHAVSGPLVTAPPPDSTVTKARKGKNAREAEKAEKEKVDILTSPAPIIPAGPKVEATAKSPLSDILAPQASAADEDAEVKKPKRRHGKSRKR